MTTVRFISASARQRQAFWAFTMVFLHLFAAPCATAMLLMPADMDCEHCQTTSSPDECAVALAATGSVIEGLAFESGRADPPLSVSQFSALLPAEFTAASPGTTPSSHWSRPIATRHSGDPPLYLVLGQLRI
jgi:hypothetical protein